MPTDIEVDQFAVGNGTTDDTLAIRQAIATGRHLKFTRGKTYLYSGGLTLQVGQIIYGNGATLKRRAQSRATTSSTITAGQTKQIDVSDPSGFAVGMDILIKNGNTYDPNNRTITAISGNTITVGSAFGINSSGTADVFSSTYGLTLRDDCRVYDLILDGNRANTAYATWENTHEVHMQGLRSLASGCYLREVPGEGFYFERDYVTLVDCSVLNCNGNAVHVSYSNRSVVNRVRVVNSNLGSLPLSEGCVFLGNNVDNLTVTGCYLENGASGVGSWDQTDNSNLSIIGNTIVNCKNASEGIAPYTTASGNVVIANNRIYDSTVLYVKGSTHASAVAWPNHVVVTGNYLRNTRIEVGAARYVDVTDNVIEHSGTGITAISVSDSKQIVVRGNNVGGAKYGVAVSGASEGVLVQGNAIVGQTDGAILMSTAGMVNCQAVNNMVTGGSAATAAYRGVSVAAKGMARGNLVNLATGESGIYADSQATVKDNVVRAGAATYSIRAASGSTGVLIKDNEVTAPVSNGGTSGNVETGTVVISA